MILSTILSKYVINIIHHPLIRWWIFMDFLYLKEISMCDSLQIFLGCTIHVALYAFAFSALHQLGVF